MCIRDRSGEKSNIKQQNDTTWICPSINNKHKRVLWVYYMYKYIKIIWINNQQHENERLLCSSIKTIHTKLALEHLCCAYLFSVADVAR